MELICKVVINLHPTTAAVNHRKRITWGSILLGSEGKEKVKKNIIIVRTPQCTSGIKYALYGNISVIFDKYVSEGRATITFKEPHHDVLISHADVNHLKKFVHIFKIFAKHVKDVKPLPSIIPLSQKTFTPPITTITVCDQDAYHQKIVSVPKLYEHTVRIYISNCILKLAPRQLRKCGKLTTLHFMGNDFRSSSYIDIESKALQSLNVVNCINDLPPTDLFSTDKIYNFAKSLTELNLNGNRWNEVPIGIFQFHNLNRLNLNDNRLTVFPDRLMKFSKLNEFWISNNRLSYLPSSIGTLRLSMLDISGNQFKNKISKTWISENGKVQPLLELASRAVLKLKIIIEEGMLPTVLMQRLVNSKRCVCGSKFVEGKEYASFFVNLLEITSCLTYVQSTKNDKFVMVSGRFCTSLKSCFPIRYSLEVT